MKKVFALLTATLLLFTACDKKADNNNPDKPGVHNELSIVSKSNW